MASGDNGGGRQSGRNKICERDGDCTDEDYMYDDGESNFSGDDDYMDDAEDTKVHGDGAPAEKRYIVLTEDGVLTRQAEDTVKIAEVLSIPPGFAALLLRRYKWRAVDLQEEWFSDDRRVRDAAGLLADGVPVPTALSPRLLTCGICFDWYPAGRMRSAGCSHYYCNECWRGYVRAAVGDGQRCLSLRCPDPACSAAVVRDLVDLVADGADRDRYARFTLRSYVEESGGRMKWCPGPGCTRAVEFIGCAGDATDVFCACTHGFCWSCGEEAHRPVSCGTVRAWLDKNRSDSETANWVLANTKHCPMCRRPIEKNQGCNHIRCSDPCGHRFCWLCLKPAGGENHYACAGDFLLDKADAGAEVETEEQQRKRQAKASLDRYLYHYERWAANLKSLEKVREDMDELERSELEKMAAVVGLPATELEFLTKAYEQITDGRRVLRWAHAYGYYLDPERDWKKRELFDELQSQANSWLERLHACAELDRKELFCAKGEAAIVAKEFKPYREKVVNFTVATRTFLKNLVEAFETDLPELC